MTEVKLTINGKSRVVRADAAQTLLAMLKDAGVNSVKEGCGIGECGACTVIMDDKPVNSCLVLAPEVEGHQVETAEGHLKEGGLSQLQQAFVDFGAIQCGFCTPGMLNSAEALLRCTPKPSRAQVVEAIAGNYCRCTGYESIIDAVLAVAAAEGAYSSPELPEPPHVGKSFPRKDGVEKAAGVAEYVHDMSLPGMLHARMLTSPHPSAIILGVDTTEAEAMPGVCAVLTGDDLTQKVGLYMQDKDILARGIVRYQGEAVAAVAAETLEQADAALAKIKVDYKLTKPVLNVHEALAEGAPKVHPDILNYSWMKGVFFPDPKNIAHHQKIRKGDMVKGFEEADHIFEHHFTNPAVQHVPMETHGVIAHDKPNEVIIITSAQSPFTVRGLFSHTFGIPESQVRVRVPYVGGGFGGKAGIALEPLAYCLAKASGRPVRLLATREEEFNTLPSRQGLDATVKTGVKADGTITALEVTYLWDAGAYADYGVNVGRAAAYAGAGPYVVPNCKIDSKVVYTNKVFGTAYRGFGHLEVLWGIERNLDLIAEKLGMDPLEMRRKNLLRVGESTITGERFTSGHGRPDLCLEKVAESIGWEAPGEKPIVKPHSGKVRGKGIAMLHKAPAMPTYTTCSAILQFNPDASVSLKISGVDYGQGTYTALAQIAADALRIPYDKVRVPWECDTDFTPYDWQTVASRFTVMGGNATLMAAEDCLNQLKETAGQVLRAPKEQLICEDGKIWVKGKPEEVIPYEKLVLGYVYPNGNAIGGPVIGRGRYIAQGLTNLDPETGQGLPALNWTFGAHGVEIEVDTDTGAIEVVKIVSAFDAGKIIHEQNCRGQVVGGVVQGQGSALNEGYRFLGGRLLNNSFVDYQIPTAKDIPREMEQHFIETPHPQGPLGARGVAEHPMISVPGAIGNALANATGFEAFHLPMNPESVYFGLKKS